MKLLDELIKLILGIDKYPKQESTNEEDNKNMSTNEIVSQSDPVSQGVDEQTTKIDFDTTSKIDFDTTSKMCILDDVDNDYILKTDIKNIDEKMLDPSNKIKQEINDYLKSEKCEEIGISIETEEQTFTYKNTRYLLTDKKHLTRVYNIICNMSSFACLKSALKRKDLINLNNTLSLENFPYRDFVKPIESEIIIKNISRSLSLIINYKLLSIEDEDKFIFNSSFLGESLGHNFIEVILSHKYIYKLQETEPNKRKEIDKIKEIQKYTKEEIQMILQDLPSKKIDESIIPKCVIKEYLTNYLSTCDEYTDKKSKVLSIEYLRCSLKIGIKIIDWLISCNILYQHTGTQKNVPNVGIDDKIIISLICSTSFFKPLICNTPEILASGIYHEITINQSKSDIKNTKTVTFDNTHKQKELISYLNQMPLSIFNPTFEFIKDYLQELITYTIYPETNIKSITNGISLFYDIDITPLLNNLTIKPVLTRLIKYSFDFSSIYDKQLKQNIISKNHKALKNMFNIISSKKFYIIGLLNDCNIYQCFSYFFLPKIATSSGRLFTKTLFLSLQGAKLCLSLIMFKSTLITTNNIDKSFNIVKKYISVESRLNIKNEISGLYNDHLKALLKINCNLNEYLTKKNMTDKLNWLFINIRKKENILRVFSLFSAKIENTPYNQIHAKDATSSGLQIISILMVSNELAHDTNLIGTTRIDIYDKILKKFLIKRQEVSEVLNKFLKEIFKIRFTEFTALKKTDPLYCFLEFFESETSKLDKILKYDFKVLNMIRNYSIPVTNMTGVVIRESRLYNVLFKIKQYYFFEKSLKKLPKELLTRQLFKQALMTVAYSAGDLSREKQFRNLIQDHYLETGSGVLPTYAEIKPLANVLGVLFKVIIKDLKPITDFLHIIKKNIKKKNSISVNLPNYSWKLHINKKRISRSQVLHMGKRIRFNITHTSNEIDVEQQQITFPSIFIHSLDAHICYFILEKTKEINKELKLQNLPLIYISFNHDCFFINYLYAPFLVPLVLEAYNSINDIKFNFPFPNQNNNHKIKICNPNLIRY
jgi:DNA-dependent RNA polymerase